MTSFLSTMLFIFAVASPTGGLSFHDTDFKCSTRPGADPDMQDVVAILDHVMLEGDMEDNAELFGWPEIDRAEFVCWRWLEAYYGVKVRRAGIFLLTKEWLEKTRQDRVAALEALVSAQDRHREMTGKYAARIEDLPDLGALSDYGLPDHLQFDLARTSGGWQARLEPEKDWWLAGILGAAYHCFAFVGEVPAGWESMRRDGQPGPGEREPECFKPRTLIRSMGSG